MEIECKFAGKVFVYFVSVLGGKSFKDETKS